MKILPRNSRLKTDFPSPLRDCVIIRFFAAAGMNQMVHTADFRGLLKKCFLPECGSEASAAQASLRTPLKGFSTPPLVAKTTG